MIRETTASDQRWNDTVPAGKDNKDSTGKWYPKLKINKLKFDT